MQWDSTLRASGRNYAMTFVLSQREVVDSAGKFHLWGPTLHYIWPRCAPHQPAWPGLTGQLFGQPVGSTVNEKNALARPPACVRSVPHNTLTLMA
jgi:hypothetical protein